MQFLRCFFSSLMKKKKKTKKKKTSSNISTFCSCFMSLFSFILFVFVCVKFLAFVVFILSQYVLHCYIQRCTVTQRMHKTIYIFILVRFLYGIFFLILILIPIDWLKCLELCVSFCATRPKQWTNEHLVTQVYIKRVAVRYFLIHFYAFLSSIGDNFFYFVFVLSFLYSYFFSIVCCSCSFQCLIELKSKSRKIADVNNGRTVNKNRRKMLSEGIKWGNSKRKRRIIAR